MIRKLEQFEKEYQEVLVSLSDPSVLGDQKKVAELGKKERALKAYSEAYHDYQSLVKEIEEFTLLIKEEKDVEDKRALELELELLLQKKEHLLALIKDLLVPEDPDDQKNVIIEIRAAAGGDEAALFAADLYRMYFNYAVSKGCKVDTMSSNEIGIGGFKEIIFEVAGHNARKYFKFESGVHRVQRVPTTESGGRIHTSTVTVAVMTEAEEADIDINPDDIRIDVFNASGHGGQNVQKNETAIRITHLPTNTVVVCQDERSKLQNKLRAMKILHTRLLDVEKQRIRDEEAQARKSQVGWGNRNEKIRTYNYPQNRVTDHRIGYSSYNLPQIMNGDMDEFVEALQLAWNKEQTSSS
jgi:peptide chain release factor 1